MDWNFTLVFPLKKVIRLPGDDRDFCLVSGLYFSLSKFA
jgi:hypothetical protein